MRAHKARKARSRQRANRVIVGILVLIALAGLYGLAGLSRAVVLTAGGPAGQAGRLAVTSALVACPAPGSAGVTGGGIAEASAPVTTGAGQVAITALNPAASSRPPSGTTRQQPGSA